MALTSGLAGQFGLAIESTPGTYLAPDHFLEFLQEGIQKNVDQVRSAGIRAGRRTAHAMVASSWEVSGSSSHELTAETVGAIFRLALGAVATTGAGPYTHTFTPGDLPTGTVQVGTPGTAGTVHPRSYTGMKIGGWSLNVDPGPTFVELQIDWVGEDETQAQALAVASYSTFTRFTFAHCTFQLAGSEVCVESVSVTGDNNLDMVHHICDSGAPTYRESGLRTYSGSAVADFADLTQYNRYLNATEVAFSLALASGTSSLTITGNVHFTGETPTVTGAEVLKQPIPFEFVHATADASAFKVVLVNDDSTP